jgi:hypothetical protein
MCIIPVYIKRGFNFYDKKLILEQDIIKQAIYNIKKPK